MIEKTCPQCGVVFRPRNVEEVEHGRWKQRIWCTWQCRRLASNDRQHGELRDLRALAEACRSVMRSLARYEKYAPVVEALEKYQSRKPGECR